MNDNFNQVEPVAVSVDRAAQMLDVSRVKLYGRAV